MKKFQYLLVPLIIYSFQAYSQININRIQSKIVTSWSVMKDRNISQGDWLEAIHSQSGFNLLGKFDFSKGFDFYKEQCIQWNVAGITLICRSSSKNWFVTIDYDQDMNSKIIYMNKIVIYSCESRQWNDVGRDLISKNGMPNRMDGFGLTYMKGGEQLYIKQDTSGSRLVNEEIPCSNQDKYLIMKLERTFDARKVLREGIEAWRYEKSKSISPAF